ncbi:hypothetical protein DFJ73DRAFT_766781 [Zopfochytrium polystomum]|nr:hypothetical protein DFJ73DRAFT_766781 [Zopfochytrium polystomum]
MAWVACSEAPLTRVSVVSVETQLQVGTHRGHVLHLVVQVIDDTMSQLGDEWGWQCGQLELEQLWMGPLWQHVGGIPQHKQPQLLRQQVWCTCSADPREVASWAAASAISAWAALAQARAVQAAAVWAASVSKRAERDDRGREVASEVGTSEDIDKRQNSRATTLSRHCELFHVRGDQEGLFSCSAKAGDTSNLGSPVGGYPGYGR